MSLDIFTLIPEREVLWDIYLRIKVPGQKIWIFLILLDNAKLRSKVIVPVCTPINSI